MKNRKDNKGKRTSFRRGGIRYACTVAWIIITCFVKHFFKNTSRVFRLRAVAAVCVGAAAALLIVQVSHSSTEVEEAHLVLYMGQKGNEAREGYEEPVICDIVLENDGGDDLTNVRFYIDGEQDGFSFVFEDGGEDQIIAPGEKWKAKVVMDPGRKAGEYFVTVAAEAGELEKRIEQVVRFVVKKPLEPDADRSPMPEHSSAPGRSPVPDKSPAPEETQDPADAAEETEKPKPSKRPEQTESRKPGVESERAEVKKPDAEVKNTEKPRAAVKENRTPEQEAAAKPGTAPETESVNKKTLADRSKKGETSKPQPPETGEPEEQTGLPAEGKTGDTAGSDDIIRVDVPAKVHLLMDPMSSDQSRQISSGLSPIRNESGFPLEVDIIRSVLNIRQNGGMMRKECSLNIDILKRDKVVVAIRNLKEGDNPIHTSFLLSSGDTAFMRFFGSIGRGTEYLWKDGDLRANVIFQFRKSS